MTTEAAANAPAVNTTAADGRKLLVDTIVYGGARYVPQAVSFLLIPIYTRYLRPEDLGAVELCISLQVVVMIVLRGGLPALLTRERFAADPAGLAACTRTITTTVLIAGFAGSVLVTAAVRTFPFGPFAAIPTHYVALAFLGATIQAVPDVQRAMFQGQARARDAARTVLISASAAVAANVFFIVVMGHGARGFLEAGVVASGVSAAVAYAISPELRGAALDRRWLREAWRYGAPLVPHHLAASGNQYIGRWVIASVGAVAAVGDLGIATRFSSPIVVVVSSFGTAMAPIYYRWRDELSADGARSRVEGVFKVSVALVICLVVGLGTVGTTIASYMVTSDFLAATSVLGVLGLQSLFMMIYGVFVAELFYRKATWSVSWIFAVATVANFVIVWLVGARGGAMGAAIGQASGAFVAAALTIWTAKRPVLSHGLARRITACIALAATAAAFGAVAPNVLDDLWLPGIAACVVLCGAVLAILGVNPRQLARGWRTAA